MFGPVTLVPDEIRAVLQGDDRPADIVSSDGVTHDHVRSFIRSERQRLGALDGGGVGDVDPPEVRVVKEFYLGNPDPGSGERRLISRDKIWLFGSQRSAPPPHDFLAHLRLGLDGGEESPALLLSDTVVTLRRAPTDLEVVLDADDSRFSRVTSVGALYGSE